MPLSKSIYAYNDCCQIYERAMESAVSGGPGVRVRQEKESDAIYLRMRMNNARAINRRDNADIYAPGDPLYKASVWDALMVTIKMIDDDFYVYVEPHGIDTSMIEDIPQDDQGQITYVKPKLLPAPVGQVQPLVTRR